MSKYEKDEIVIKGMIEESEKWAKELSKDTDQIVILISLLKIMNTELGIAALKINPNLMEKASYCILRTLITSVPRNKLIKLLDPKAHIKLMTKRIKKVTKERTEKEDHPNA